MTLIALPQSQNLVVRSDEFDSASWDKASFPCSVSANATTAPDGTVTADRITASATGVNLHGCFQLLTGLAPDRIQTVSCFVKRETQRYVNLGDVQHGSLGFVDSWFDLTNGVVGTTSNTLRASIEPATTWVPSAGAGWYRISVTAFIPAGAGADTTCGFFVQPTSGDGVRNWAPAGTETVFVWGAQFASANWSGPRQQTVAATVNTGAMRNLIGVAPA